MPVFFIETPEDEDKLKDIMMLDGYESGEKSDWTSAIFGSSGIDNNDPAPASGSSGSSVTVVTTDPGSDPVASYPDPYDYYLYNVDKFLNRGWNTSSRTVNPLVAGDYLEFNLAEGITGLYIAIAPINFDDKVHSRFTHGLMFSLDGVMVFESGSIIATLASAVDPDALYRIYRRADNSVAYAIISDGTAVLYESAADLPLAAPFDLYGYSFLYSSGDTITDAFFDTDTIALSEVEASAVGTGLVWTGALKAEAVCTAAVGIQYILAGDLEAICTCSTMVEGGKPDNIDATVPEIKANFYGDGVHGSGYVDTSVPEIDGAFFEWAYIPPDPVVMFGSIGAIDGNFVCVTSCPGSFNATLPELKFSGGESPSETERFGYFDASLPAFEAEMYDDFYPGWAFALNRALVLDGALGILHLIILVDNNMTVTGTITADMVFVEQFLEQLSISDSNIAVLGTYLAGEVEDMLISFSSQGQVVSGEIVQPALDTGRRVWVVNLDNGAATQYDNFGFNSFMSIGDYDYGVAEDGIYRLDGTTDAGLPIDALIDFGTTAMETKQRKGITNLYVGGTSDGKLLLRIAVDGGDTYTYRARSSSETIDQHRFDTGKGLVGNYHSLELLNEDGDDFDIESIHFEPIPVRRKI